MVGDGLACEFRYGLSTIFGQMSSRDLLILQYIECLNPEVEQRSVAEAPDGGEAPNIQRVGVGSGSDD